ncbi:DNA polymerase [Turkey adenovirus 3]|uniref:DNA polymerase n=1 Tax=Turkey adenovirus 3 TaxID=41678 RepID=Q9YUR6_9ADEN|nr:DNA polymerase [Turkey adenovirus 3]AP_000478.1 pol [Turkey siadenovirus A]AAC64523.1 DNA polymerase [Turkey adenovirus 3]
MSKYIYTTQNEIPYRLQICKKDIKATIIEIAWTYNLFNCKKLAKKVKDAQSYILICSKYKPTNSDIENVKNLPVKSITIWKKLTGCVMIQNEFKTSHEYIELDFIYDKSKLCWIKSWTQQQKCSSCGRIYSAIHTCNDLRSTYYYNSVDNDTRKFWETIPFQPIGENENTKKLFLIYDIETFTLAETSGVLLNPLLLCFSIFGDDCLINICKTEIAKIKSIQTKNSTYFWFSKVKNFISTEFRKLRNNILFALTDYFTKLILTPENREILEDFAQTQNLESITNINLSEHTNLIMSLKVKPIFIEFYIIGHNIQSFDEILLATQILQDENLDITPLFTVERNFMPRQGRILFNDITIKFPNPDYYVAKEEKKNNKSEILSQIKEGIPHPESIKNLYIKSMVRDTFQITHTSLKEAAKAYNLKIHKGCCPFKAINEYMSTNSLSTDSDSFPSEKYWSSKEEYNEQKEIWLEKKEVKYDIVKELIDYCIKDVKITEELTKTLLNTFDTFIKEELNLKCNFNIFKRPTISSNSHAIFRQLHFKQNGTKASTLPDIVAPSDEMYSFIRQSVRGGRCYPTHLGIFKEKIFVYDICGMYASALTHPMPYGFPIGEKERNNEITKLNEKLKKTKTKLSYFTDIKPMVVMIDAIPPPPEHLDPLPPLCSRQSGKLCWTNEILKNEIVTSIDIITLHNRGWKVNIIPHKLNTVFPTWNTCCLEYVTKNILAKEKATVEKNPVKRAISKLLSNALYGSFATRESNDITIFENHIQENPKIRNQLLNKQLTIDSITTLPTYNLPYVSIENLTFTLKNRTDSAERNLELDDELTSPFNSLEFMDESPASQTSTSTAHVGTYKPFNILDVTSENLTIYMLKSTNLHPTNKRYPTQLASFVLAWTRAFMSEWREILYSDEDSIPVQFKTIKSIYGDTDSLFLTEKGHQNMLKYGQHRIKNKNSQLTFDPKKPSIVWAVECETWCNLCNSPAYSSKSIFLAPKLYALKEITCTTCKNSKTGKLRAKGHCTADITFEILEECFNYHTSELKSGEIFQTERTALKRTLCKSYGKFSPFSVHEIQLIRELRPWNDPTLYFLKTNTLIPYDLYHPNPRITNPILLQEFEDE